jgi:hypothetical protein
LKDLLYNLQKNNPNFSFDFNSIDNGMMVPKRSIQLDINGHTVHNNYNDAISEKLDEICTNIDYSDLEKFDKIENLIMNVKEQLRTEVLLGNRNVNDIVNF